MTLCATIACETITIFPWTNIFCFLIRCFLFRQENSSFLSYSFQNWDKIILSMILLQFLPIFIIILIFEIIWYSMKLFQTNERLRKRNDLVRHVCLLKSVRILSGISSPNNNILEAFKLNLNQINYWINHALSVVNDSICSFHWIVQLNYFFLSSWTTKLY